LLTNFQRFADLGLSINISEMDVRVAEIAGTMVDKLALQQQIYHRVVSACVATSACDAVTTWGISDAYSWVDSTFGPDDPLPFDEAFDEKPAYYGMVDGFVGNSPDAEGVAPNLVRSGSFETDAYGWYGFGSAAPVVTSAFAHTGSKSAVGAGRTDTWQGPAVNLTSLVQPGFEYETEAFVRIAGATSDAVSMSLKTECAGEPAAFDNVAATTATDGDWNLLSGTFLVPDCELVDVALYFEGPAAGVDVLVDDGRTRTRGVRPRSCCQTCRRDVRQRPVQEACRSAARARSSWRAPPVSARPHCGHRAGRSGPVR
jgi:hypothetical protein